MPQLLNIVIGADHRGYQLKEMLKEQKMIGPYAIMWHDVGAHSTERSDYPIIAHAAIKAMQEKKYERAILLCASGTGMAIVANRYPGIRAGVVWSEAATHMSTADDGINVLVLPVDFVDEDCILEMVMLWLTTPFKGGRYQQRIDMIDKK